MNNLERLAIFIAACWLITANAADLVPIPVSQFPSTNKVTPTDILPVVTEPDTASRTSRKISIADWRAYNGSVVPTLTALLARDPAAVTTNVYVLGRNSPGDGGEGPLTWVPGSTTTNQGTVHAPTYSPAPVGTWRRQYSGRPNLRWFGPAADGTTEDTIVVQEAVNLGRGLIVPEGVYVISGLSLPSGTHLSGTSTNAIFKKKAGSVDHMIRNYVPNVGFTNEANNIIIEQLQLDGNKTASPQGTLIYLGGNNILIRDCFVHDSPNAGIELVVRTNASGNYRILNNYVLNCSIAGQNYGGIAVTGGNGVLVQGNQIECSDGGQAYGIDIEPNASTVAADVSAFIIANNRIKGGNLQVDFANVTGLVTNVIVTGNVVDYRGAYDRGFDFGPLFLRNFSNFQVSDNVCFDHSSSAVPTGGAYCWGLGWGMISGNVFNLRDYGGGSQRAIWFNPVSPSHDVAVFHNLFVCPTGTVDYGILSESNSITNGYFRGNIGHGVVSLQTLNGTPVWDWMPNTAVTNFWALNIVATNINGNIFTPSLSVTNGTNTVITMDPTTPVVMSFTTPTATDARIEFNTVDTRQGTIGWQTGQFTIDSNTNLMFHTMSTPRLAISSGGNVNLPGLTASMVVLTDANKNLVSGQVALGTQVNGNLPVTNLNGGSGATSSTFWRGDGVWATPSSGGSVTNFSVGDLSSLFTVSAPTTFPVLAGVDPGGHRIWGWDDTDNTPRKMIIGANLSYDAATDTLNASAGAGGYTEVQEETTPLTARTKLNFVGATATAADNAGTATTDVTFDSDVNAVAGLSTTGVMVRTGAGTATTRTITGGSGITMANGDGVAGNPTASLNITGLTAETTIDTANDTVPFYDASEGANNKMTLDTLKTAIVSISELDVTGSGTDFTPAAENTYEKLTFGGGDLELALTTGTWVVTATLNFYSSNTRDLYAKFRNVTDAVDIAKSERIQHYSSGNYQVTIQRVITVASTKTIETWVKVDDPAYNVVTVMADRCDMIAVKIAN